MTPGITVVEEINVEIARLPINDQLQVRSIAHTLRLILKADPVFAPMALALVGAEVAGQ